jgi:predicted nucleic acid-binding Zn ribbon protein
MLSNAYSTIFDNMEIAFLPIMLMSVLQIAYRILFMLSIGFDCKAKGNKKQAMWMILSFFFPIIVGIVYACTRSKNVSEQKVCVSCGATLSATDNFCTTCGNSSFTYAENPNSKKQNKTSIILFAITVVCFVAYMVLYVTLVANLTSQVLSDYDNDLDSDYYSDYYDYDYETHYGYTVNGETVYYDKNGNVYNDDDDVVYYDNDNNTYTYDEDDYCFVNSMNEEFNFIYCFVDTNGYFYYDEAGAKDDENATVFYNDDISKWTDSDGNVYYYADEVSWDVDGNLVDSYDGTQLN